MEASVSVYLAKNKSELEHRVCLDSLDWKS